MGFDILLDEQYKGWILEINDHPSLNIYFDTKFMGSKSDEKILCQVDLHVKKNLIRDTLELVLDNIDEDSFKSFERCYPSNDPKLKLISKTIQNLR